MKLSKLYIEQFRHLENLDFDFTYPSDFHDETKRGKPLEKICFIGQSATGKTSLLELIREQVFRLQNIIYCEKGFKYSSDNVGIIKELQSIITFSKDKLIITLKPEELIIDKKIYIKYNGSGSFRTLFLNMNDFILYYLKANLISENNIKLFNQNPLNIIEKYPNFFRDQIKRIFKNINTIDFDDDVEAYQWMYLFETILLYRKKFSQKMSEMLHSGLISDIVRLQQEFDVWQIENPNPLNDFSEKFNPILEKINLEIDLVNTEYPIPVKNKKTNEIIPIQNTSTGTKGLLLSILPIYKLNTQDAIILIDEPERSLYPDIQMDIMETYQKLAPNAQFMVATHSPFIAASFEPEERFILYFNEQGKVAVRRGSSPIGDDPNDILYNDFGIDYINKYGKEKYNEYLDLKQKVMFEKNEKIKSEYLNKLEKIGDTYNF